MEVTLSLSFTKYFRFCNVHTGFNLGSKQVDAPVKQPKVQRLRHLPSMMPAKPGHIMEKIKLNEKLVASKPSADIRGEVLKC